MGTKSDFYLGFGIDALWLGSIAWDGHPAKIPQSIINAKSQQEYIHAVKSFIKERPDGTDGLNPNSSWPWIWDTSQETHYSYSFDGNRVVVSHFGGPWTNMNRPIGFELPTHPKQTFPDMSERRSCIMGAESGLLFLPGKNTK